MSDSLSGSALYHSFRDIIRFIHAGHRVEDIAAIAVVKIAQAFAAQGAIVQFYQRATGQRLTPAVYGLGEMYRQAGPFAGLEKVVEIFAEHKVVVIGNLNRDERLLSCGIEPKLLPEMLLVAPFGLQEELVGFICLIFDQQQEFSTAALDFLAALAQQCTYAINQARLLEKQQLQFEQLAHQTERLTALGRMAAGVTHELNNPLSSILLYSSNMLKKVPPSDFLHEGLEIIIQETKRCKTIIQELQEFSRSKEPKKIIGNINTVLGKVIHLLENEFRRRRIRLQQNLDPRLPNLLIDIGQMQQVFANLLINASDAVNSKGEITVATHFDEPKQAIRIEVADNGCGIPKEYLGRICEPFFSTKPKGTGLGLAVTHGFIMNHQGELQVASEPGQGTRFTIIIPLGTPELESARTTR